MTGFIPLLKWIGSIILFLVCLLLGISLSERFRQRVQTLESLFRFFNRLKSYLRYQRFSTAEILDRLTRETESDSFPFLSDCSVRMKNGVPFPQAWEEAVRKTAEDAGYRKEDLPLLLRLSEVLGTSDVDGQIKGIELMERELEASYEEAQAEQKTKGKLYRSLGALAGAGVVVLLL